MKIANHPLGELLVSVSIGEETMINLNLGKVALGVVFGITMLAISSSAEAQCPYSGGYGGSYQYGNSYYAPSYGYNRGYYGGGYYNAGRPRLRRALAVAVVAGAVVAVANNDNRSRSRRRF